jgi:hypothetical protein
MLPSLDGSVSPFRVIHSSWRKFAAFLKDVVSGRQYRPIYYRCHAPAQFDR